jgi:hypothetical protein
MGRLDFSYLFSITMQRETRIALEDRQETKITNFLIQRLLVHTATRI